MKVKPAAKYRSNSDTKTTEKSGGKITGKSSSRRASRSSEKSGSKSSGGSKARHKTEDLKYKLHQAVVYPLHGVGQVQSIEERPFQEKVLLYYIIYIEALDMTVMVPVERADELGIRAIVSVRESKKALQLISEDYEPVPTDWKMRYQMNLDLLKSGSVLDIATVVRTLYHRSKIKELPILERKLFDSALRLMVDEISNSLKKEKEEVEQLIFSKMEQEKN